MAYGLLPDGFNLGLDPVADARRFRVTAGGVALVTPERLGQSVRNRACGPAPGVAGSAGIPAAAVAWALPKLGGIANPLLRNPCP